MNPDRACEHNSFVSVVQVDRLSEVEGGPITGFAASIAIRCMDCNEPFRFTGLPKGVSFTHPTTSLDEAELRCPIRPAQQDDDYGLNTQGPILARGNPHHVNVVAFDPRPPDDPPFDSGSIAMETYSLPPTRPSIYEPADWTHSPIEGEVSSNVGRWCPICETDQCENPAEHFG